MRETRHIHLKLDALQPQIEEWFEKACKDGDWSKNGRIITESWLKAGLRDRGITRDLKWGTPIPLDVFTEEKDKDIYRDKVFYVWFDACIGYVSITANYTEEWQRWWKDPDNVQLYQFMGKGLLVDSSLPDPADHEFKITFPFIQSSSLHLN